MLIKKTYSINSARMQALKPTHLLLRPMTFEIPGFSQKSAFVGREWLFPEMERCLGKDPTLAAKLKGLGILGDVGMGKTSIIAKMVSLSTLGTLLINSNIHVSVAGKY